jgi:hypothetical protein
LAVGVGVTVWPFAFIDMRASVSKFPCQPIGT